MKKFFDMIGCSNGREKKAIFIQASEIRFIRCNDKTDYIFRLQPKYSYMTLIQYCESLLSDINLMAIENDDHQIIPKFTYLGINQTDVEISTDHVNELLELLNKIGVIEGEDIARILYEITSEATYTLKSNESTPLLC